MKKKRSFITIISSIFGVAAICGLFALSSLGSKKQIETKAEALVVDNGDIFTTSVYTGNFNYETRTTARGSTPNGSTDIYVIGSYSYFKNIVNNEKTYSASFYISSMLFYNEYLNKSFRISPNTSGYEPELNLTFSTPYNSLSLMSSELSLVVSNLSIFVNSVNDINLEINFNIYDRVNDNYIVPVEGVYNRFRAYVPGVTTGQLQLEMCYNNNYGYNGETTYFEDVYGNFFTPFSLVNLTLTDTQSADYATGYESGYNSGFIDGYNQGNASGQSIGYQQGFSDGQYIEHQNMLQEVDNAYNEGLNDGLSSDQTAMTIFSGILNVALVPINFFLACFNFEILGINLSAFIRALFTVVLTIVVVKLVLGNSGGGD